MLSIMKTCDIVHIQIVLILLYTFLMIKFFQAHLILDDIRLCFSSSLCLKNKMELDVISLFHVFSVFYSPPTTV